MADQRLTTEIERRRTMAIISHPDAGKTTLTEKLLLYSGAIQRAGSVTGKAGTTSTTSDWMDIEQKRGISISSSAMQVEYEGHLLNILDTPGHQDFSEDTYRTLMAVDSAIMLIDIAKGVEPQTIKLFKVCKDRGIPIITFINKLDRPGRNPFEVMEEVENVLGISCVPLTWPIGIGDEFKGVLELISNQIALFQEVIKGQYRAPVKVTDFENADLLDLIGSKHQKLLIEEIDLIRSAIEPFDRQLFFEQKQTPVFWGSAINNFGVENFLSQLIELAPKPSSLTTSTGEIPPESDFFSGFVYKVQANMNQKHRDRVAFMRITSGKFERGMNAYHFRSEKQIKLSYPYKIFGQDRSMIEEAFPGDVIGLINPGVFSVGDVVSSGTRFDIPRFPRFAPEIFVRVFPAAYSFSKGFKKGVEQLGEEGVIQLFRDKDGTPTPILGAVGQLQLEVFASRMEAEYNEKIKYEHLSAKRARWLGQGQQLPENRNFNYVLDTEDRIVVLFDSDWELNYVIEKNPTLTLLDAPPNEQGIKLK